MVTARPLGRLELGGVQALVHARRAAGRARRRRGALRRRLVPRRPLAVTPAHSVAAQQRRNRGCRLCLEAGFPIEPRPVLEGRAGQRAYLLGLAPGLVEAATGRPWQGRAGGRSVSGSSSTRGSSSRASTARRSRAATRDGALAGAAIAGPARPKRPSARRGARRSCACSSRGWSSRSGPWPHERCSAAVD